MDEEIGLFLGVREVENGKDGEIVKAEAEAILERVEKEEEIEKL